MIDLTPLDVRKKREDFRKILRGYDPEEVDTFLALAAERMEELVKENLTLKERTERLQEQVSSQMGRERAVQEALVTAQELRDDIRGQARAEADEVLGRAQRESELLRKEAEAEAEEILARAERQLVEREEALKELERRRVRFLMSFRSLLEREMDVVEVEEGREPLEETPVDLEFGRGSRSEREAPDTSEDRVSGDGASPEERRSVEGRPSPEELPAPEGPSSKELRSAEDRPSPETLPSPVELPSPEDLPSAEDLPSPGERDDDDPKRWLSSLVERELNDKSDEDSWS